MPRFAPARVVREPRPGGGFVLRSPTPPGEPERCLGDMLVRWAREAPDRTFLAERAPDTSWRRVSYLEALAAVRGYGQLLLDAELSPTRPLAILSGNSIDHALLALGAMHVGVPVAAISPAYSVMSQDHAKLRELVHILAPGAVWAQGAAFDRALRSIDPSIRRLELTHTEPTAEPTTEPTTEVDRAFAQITPDTVAKVLFTSGSTGTPKGVVNTQRMLCANQAGLVAGWQFLVDKPPVVVDWLPWSHTFGANHNFNMILANGGTLYIDAGKPAPGAFDATLANLREIPSTIYFNVPRGFDMLVAHLETDEALREVFFRDLDVLFYAAAALSPATWTRFAKIAPSRLAMTSAWGSTETSPLVTQVHYPIERAGVIGLPIPGHDLAFAPIADKLELRVRGPSVTPGYWIAGGGIEPAPRDELGFYPMGDAGTLADADHPERGVVFDGRVAENFKLASGTWVHVGELRIALIAACSPLVADAVITGHDRHEVGALIFPAPGRTVDDDYRRELAGGVARCNEARVASSTRIARMIVLSEPASIDAGEITDKGYINQRAVLSRRASLVDAMYADDAARS